MGDDGLLIKLELADVSRRDVADVSWISKFPHEHECILRADAMLEVKTVDAPSLILLRFEVLNALTGPGTHPEIVLEAVAN